MSKAGEKRGLDGGDEDKLPFTDEQLAALEEPNKGELPECEHMRAVDLMLRSCSHPTPRNSSG